MMRCGVALALTSILGLSACAAPPDGPTVLEVPGPNKTLPQFQAADAGRIGSLFRHADLNS